MELLYEELTYTIIGTLYISYNKLGYGYQEKYYQRVFALQLNEANIPYQKELHHRVVVNGKTIGRYFIDFAVDGKVVVELKIANDFYQSHINQVLAYLKSHQLRLGILAIITPKGIRIKRIIN